MLSATLTVLATFLAGIPQPAGAQSQLPLGVIATGNMGPTNPPAPTLGTAINQTSMARLLSLNSVDDFCLFAPPSPQDIANSETFEVAWCTQQRNNARLIPDGTITGVSFLKTDFYVQIMGYGDLTKLNIPAGDFGGELDPHGAYGDGNPVGGNVTSNITGNDQNYAEWMLYIDYNQFCLRVCTNANSTYSAADMCWHELDEMGCLFVMPGNYNVNGTLSTRLVSDRHRERHPVFSTFAQRFTGTLTGGSVYTVGDLSTPSAPYFTPSSSNCVTTSTISNGVALASLGITAAPSGPTGAGSSGASGTAKAPSETGKGSANSAKNARMSDGGVEAVVGVLATLSGLGAVVLFA
ncbi:unnamed protein product [Cyclocybe aegerita]|uniref:Immunoreactive mannoprotein MP88 n=1 Tax=Cyclocybe aegerita TaxID=1973307 RepID=A0A8S0X1R8_CYCAE|nr:unnamed protein product [Cyclocybe aegerita]